MANESENIEVKDAPITRDYDKIQKDHVKDFNKGLSSDENTDHVNKWMPNLFGKIIESEYTRERIQHYDAATFEFMSNKDGTIYAGYAAGIVDYRDDFRLYGMVKPDKYPNAAKIFIKIAKSFKLLKHYNKPPKNRKKY